MNQIKKAVDEVLLVGWSTLVVLPETNILEFALNLGKPIPSRLKGPVVDNLRVVPKESANERSLSAIYGKAAFPWHTDMAHIRIPPRFSIMRSRSQAVVRPTLLLDSRELYNNHDEDALRREPWLVNGGRGRFLTPVLNDTLLPGANIFRYDSNVMRPTSYTGRSLQLLKAFVQRRPSISIEWTLDTCLLLDNWRMLHARPQPISECEPERLLERVLVSAVDERNNNVLGS